MTAPRFIDSHAHLAGEAFDQDRTEVIERARDAGCTGIVCIGESMQAADAARALSERWSGFIWHTAGVHPHDAADFRAERDVPLIREHVQRHGAVAVGECGLDYHYDHSPRQLQRAALDAQIQLAAELSRPIVLHSRDAEADTRDALEQAATAGVRGVAHCFTGTPDLAEAVLQAGWYLSFAGIITFKRFDQPELLRMVPADRLLVESDSPYLAPVPNRGRRNEPAWVALTLARLAEVRDTTAELLGEQTAANARELFGLATGSPNRLD